MGLRFQLTILLVGVLVVAISGFGVAAFGHATMNSSSQLGSMVGMGSMCMMSCVGCDHMMANVNGMTAQCQAMCQQNMAQCQSMMQAQDMTQCASMM